MSNTNSNTMNTPENFNNILQNQPIPRLNPNQQINNYFQQEHSSIGNCGYIDENKSTRNIRLLSLNPHGCNPFNSSKMVMLQQAIGKLQLDVILLNEVNTKWTTRNISKIEQEMTKIDRAPTIITADSNQ